MCVQAGDDGDDPTSHRNYISATLQTGLCDWSAKYFAQPVMKVNTHTRAISDKQHGLSLSVCHTHTHTLPLSLAGMGLSQTLPPNITPSLPGGGREREINAVSLSCRGRPCVPERERERIREEKFGGQIWTLCVSWEETKWMGGERVEREEEEVERG